MNEVPARPAMAAIEMAGTSGPAAVRVVVIGGDALDRARTEASIARQSVPVQLSGAVDVIPADDAAVTIFLMAGAELDVTACERCAWFLATHPEAHWLTGGSHEQPNVEESIAALLAVCAVRSSDGRRALGDERWWRACSAADAPAGDVVRMVGTMRQQGLRGACMAQPLLLHHAAAEALLAATNQGETVARELRLTPADVVDREIGIPSPWPLQRLAQVAPSGRPVGFASNAAVPPDADGGPPRLLMLLQGFPMGGYTAFNADLLPRLVARGHAVTTVCTEWWRSDWRLDRVRSVAPDVHHVPSVVPFAYMPDYIAHLIASRRIDVVFLSHCFLAYRMLPMLRAKFPAVTFVDYVHTEWFEQNMYGSYAMMSARWSPYIDAHIASSRALGTALVAQGADRARVHVAHIGIDSDVWSATGINRAEIRAALGASDDTILLLFAGRISPEKRPLLAVEALRALRAEGRNVRLAVAGDGPLLVALHAELQRQDLAAHAVLLGELDETTLRLIYAAADIYFAPSEIEGIARTLYEAMALGCVPVVSDVGGQRELVLEEVGSLVPAQPGTLDMYLPALRQWCDPQRRRAAGAAARALIVSQFDSRRTVDAIEHAFVAAMARPTADCPDVEPSLAEEVAVLGLETMRRHVRRAPVG
jgi:glycosyltransferase involved in cell wall biosynthesis